MLSQLQAAKCVDGELPVRGEPNERSAVCPPAGDRDTQMKCYTLGASRKAWVVFESRWGYGWGHAPFLLLLEQYPDLPPQ